MEIKLAKNLLGKTVYYDTKQINFDGCRRGGRAAKTRSEAKRRQKALCSRFFRVRLGCNVTVLKLS